MKDLVSTAKALNHTSNLTIQEERVTINFGWCSHCIIYSIITILRLLVLLQAEPMTAYGSVYGHTKSISTTSKYNILNFARQSVAQSIQSAPPHPCARNSFVCLSGALAVTSSILSSIHKPFCNKQSCLQ